MLPEILKKIYTLPTPLEKKPKKKEIWEFPTPQNEK